MSFITKRERVFDQYELYNLPTRNEGKLKAYASCTDARAWSHFSSDKTEHLVEFIKRNNEVYPGKFIPLNVIIDLMMGSKNAEIRRLKLKLTQFEQMLAAYDLLELNCDQKCEIENAHAMIKAANRELEDVDLHLDISGLTEIIDSEDFATGKSRGDEPFSARSKYSESVTPMIKSRDTSKSGGDEPWVPVVESIHEIDLKCVCDVGTSVHDPRIVEMQEVLISKDARLSALQNTIAVMENDVCEPYCIYAHIYTALEKIFATLRQVDKYRLYLDLLSTGKDIRCIDIKRKILFKLKVLEKFCVALIAPCSEHSPKDETCKCYRAEISHTQTAFAITSSGAKKDSIDVKRAHLVADIMQHDEMKDILSKDSISQLKDPETDIGLDMYSIDTENLNRLKNLQVNYDDLMSCYENLKHERNNLSLRCQQYEDLDRECNALREQLREYTTLYSEREHYRRRSEDLDSLKQQYIILSDETASLENQLKAEIEINSIKTNTLEGLRNENIELEKRLNDVTIALEKKENALQCKLKETECKVMCQEQQIRSLSNQIDRLLEQEPDKQNEDITKSMAILDEIESLKDQIRTLKEALHNSEEEKQQLQDQYQDQLQNINDLKMEIEEWKCTCEKALQRKEYLEQYTDNFREEALKLMDENKEQTTAVANLINVLNNKSLEINNLREELEQKNKENNELYNQLQNTKQTFSNNVLELENQKQDVLCSLELARQESQELLQKVKDYDELVHKKEDLSKTLVSQEQDHIEVKNMLIDCIEENKKLKLDLANQENDNAFLSQELQKLKDVHDNAMAIINSLQEENRAYRLSLEITKKDSETLEEKLKQYENLRENFESLRQSNESLQLEKLELEDELREKANELNDTFDMVELTKKESEKLLEKVQQSEKLKDSMINLGTDFQKLVGEKESLLKELEDKNKYLVISLQNLNMLKAENEELFKKSNRFSDLEVEIGESKMAYNELLAEKNLLQIDFDNKTKEYNDLYNALENKIEENRNLHDQVKSLQNHHKEAQSNLAALHDETMKVQTTLKSVRRESEVLMDKLKQYNSLINEYDKLKKVHDQICKENEKLLYDYEMQLKDLNRLEAENRELNIYNVNLTTHNEDLERALVDARTELARKTSEQPAYLDVKKEIDEMKAEKLNSHQKIRELLGQLEASEHIISNLSEDVIERDDKIAILQNHINCLDDEVRKLHENLAEVVNAGEGIKESGVQKIDQSISLLEAHHSKATHNMKMEIARLQNSNTDMEKELCRASDESIRAKQSHTAKILHLQNEREIIVTDIKQIEMTSIGDSALTQDQCSLEEILRSLERIKKHIEDKNSQCAALEQTLLKVQTSSQLLLSKADEAKKIIEKEKQKVIHEKEEAIADRQNMEKQLLHLKDTLEQQANHDKTVIKDLEGEILNQKLILDKINSSTHNYITKLEEEMQSMQNLYQNSLAKISELQDKLNSASSEKANVDNILLKLHDDLKEKSKEVTSLQIELNEIKNTPKTDFKSQTGTSIANFLNESIQTDKMNYADEIRYNDPPDPQKIEDVDVMNLRKPIDLRPKQIPQSFNEVQILTANIEPTFDSVKNTYLTYKLKQLSTCRLEHCSISSFEENLAGQRVVDIYSRQSDMHTDSSKLVANLDEDNSKQLTLSTLGSDVLNNPFVSTSEKSTDKDLFLIYHDSDGSRVDEVFDNKGTWSHAASSSQPEVSMSEMAKRSIRLNQQNPNESRDTLKSENQKRPDEESYEVNPEDGVSRKELMIQPNENQLNKAAARDSQYKTVVGPPKTKTVRYSGEVTGLPEKEPNNEMDSVGAKKQLDAHDFNQFKTDLLHKKSLPRDYVYAEDVNQSRAILENDDITIKELQESIPSKPKYYSEVSSSKFPQDSSQTKDLNHGTLSSDPQTRPLRSDPNIRDTDKHKSDQKRNNYSDEENFEVRGIKNKDIYIRDAENQISDHRNRNIQNDFSALDAEDIKPNPNINKYRNSSERNQTNQYFTDKEPVKHMKLSSDSNKDDKSHHQLSRVGADVLIFKNENVKNDSPVKSRLGSFGLEYILDTVKQELAPNNNEPNSQIRRTRSDDAYNMFRDGGVSESSPGMTADKTVSSFSGSPSNRSPSKSVTEQSVMVNIDPTEDYGNKIRFLSKTLQTIEKDYKKKIDAIKVQYDSHIKSIINEHNHGVTSIQSLHEETLKDVIKIHENEVESLRSMSIEAMRKAEKLENENRLLKFKLQTCKCLPEEQAKICTPDTNRKKSRNRGDMKMLTKTNVEAFNVKPKMKTHGPCTCSLDVNVSDTIRNIFEQVDVEQRKIAEHAYMKYIATKILSATIEALDAQELSFLHFKVCRAWKSKISKEEALQKKIDSLENELMNKQRHAQQHIAELDRKVAEERRRLQEVREAVCRSSHETPYGSLPTGVSSTGASPTSTIIVDTISQTRAIIEDCGCGCSRTIVDIGERRSAGDLVPGLSNSPIRSRGARVRQYEVNRAVLAKLDVEERKEKKLYDEPPTRLRRAHDRIANRKK